MLSLEQRRFVQRNKHYSIFQKHYVKFRTNSLILFCFSASLFQKHYVKFRTLKDVSVIIAEI